MSQREHVVDGKPCWCGPLAKREGEAIIWVHREIPPCPDCAALEGRLRELRADLEKARETIKTQMGDALDYIACQIETRYFRYEHGFEKEIRKRLAKWIRVDVARQYSVEAKMNRNGAVAAPEGGNS